MPKLVKTGRHEELEQENRLLGPSAASEIMKHVDLTSLLKQKAEMQALQKPETSAISLRDILNVLFKRKRQVILLFLATSAAVAIGTFASKPVYQAEAQLLVKLGRESVYTPAAGNAVPIVNYDREERINSEIEILKSRTLVEKVVKMMGPAIVYPELNEENKQTGFMGRIEKSLPRIKTIKERIKTIKNRIFPKNNKKLSSAEIEIMKFQTAANRIEKAIEVNQMSESNLIQVNFKHHDPGLAAMVVNNLGNAYLDTHLEVHRSPQNVEFFQEQSQLLKNKLEQAEGRLKALKKEHHITSLKQERTLLLDQVAALRADLNRTLSQEVETEKRIRQLRSRLDVVPETISQAEEGDLNQDLISELQARMVELQLEEKKLLTKYTDRSRLVQNVKVEIGIVAEKLVEQETKRYGRKRSELNPTYQRLQELVFQNEAELDAIRAKAKIQQSHLADYQRKLEKMNQLEVKINQLQQEVDVDRANYRLYLSKFEESRITEAMDDQKISNVSIIEMARPPRKPVSPKIMLNLFLGLLLGAFGGIGLAFFMEHMDDKLEKVEDVENALNLPLLASIPELRKRRKSGIG